jgi:hypothetical protein
MRGPGVANALLSKTALATTTLSSSHRATRLTRSRLTTRPCFECRCRRLFSVTSDSLYVALLPSSASLSGFLEGPKVRNAGRWQTPQAHSTTAQITRALKKTGRKMPMTFVMIAAAAAAAAVGWRGRERKNTRAQNGEP